MIYSVLHVGKCQMNLKHQQKAKDALMLAWNMAKEDEFLEPFIEHHGLLQGLLESCIRKEDSKLYNKLSDKVISFSRGWMGNPQSNVREFRNRCIIHGRILDCHAGKP